ncbi:MAG TPA: hypothetical protein VD926_03570 [Acidimicrobiales bacterium]|nr:hypothetical protein [Acidimicrobiales bacterium]
MVPVLLLGLVAWSWVVTGLAPFAGSTTAAVLATGGAAAALGAVRRPRPASPRRVTLRSAAPWVVVAAALTAWQLASFVQEPRDEHPTISSLTNAALDGRPLRALAFAAWVVGAAWLARR